MASATSEKPVREVAATGLTPISPVTEEAGPFATAWKPQGVSRATPSRAASLLETDGWRGFAVKDCTETPG
ncbi:hypothetical protein KH5H1_24580 [Corallococcus caeni]|nr:hypothetical protein KH5H1_24580 [Corallococcus sp. KH5-1]